MFKFIISLWLLNVVNSFVNQYSSENCSCGKENLNGYLKTRVVGGSEVWPPNRYPWLAALKTSRGGVFCGAALINDRYLLTASHCINQDDPANTRVVLGAHDLNDKSYQVLQPEKFIVHEEYDDSNQHNDIALVKLKNPVAFTSKIRPICLPSIENETFDKLVVAGWGMVRENGSSSPIPKEVVVPQLPESRCSVFGESMTSNNICAGGMNQKDSCQGDSGGPLVAKVRGDSYVVAGVTSFGFGCGREGIPGVYTKVKSYLDWIRDHSADGQQCSIPLSKTTTCGVRRGLKRMKRIVGGTATRIMEFPWVAAIALGGQVRGSAILLNQRFLLTSAKNWKKIDPNGTLIPSIRIVLGTNDVSQREVTKKEYRVKKVHFHPKFGSSHPFSMDFALIELTRDVTSNFVPICLPAYKMVICEGNITTIAGWGRTTSTGSRSKELLKGIVNLKSYTQCSSSYLNNFEPNMLCASGQSTNACFGDEGGPLMIDVDGKSTLLGVKSWGSPFGCSLSYKPSVFADVRWALPWIISLTGMSERV